MLRALGPDATGWLWVVSEVESQGEALWAMGPSVPELEALGRSGDRVTGSRLALIADGIDQVVRGEFKAYCDEGAAEPVVRVMAFDGSCYEVWSEDAALVRRVQASFRDTVPNAPPIP